MAKKDGVSFFRKQDVKTKEALAKVGTETGRGLSAIAARGSKKETLREKSKRLNEARKAREAAAKKAKKAKK